MTTSITDIIMATLGLSVLWILFCSLFNYVLLITWVKVKVINWKLIKKDVYNGRTTPIYLLKIADDYIKEKWVVEKYVLDWYFYCDIAWCIPFPIDIWKYQYKIVGAYGCTEENYNLIKTEEDVEVFYENKDTQANIKHSEWQEEQNQLSSHLNTLNKTFNSNYIK